MISRWSFRNWHVGQSHGHYLHPLHVSILCFRLEAPGPWIYKRRLGFFEHRTHTLAWPRRTRTVSFVSTRWAGIPLSCGICSSDSRLETCYAVSLSGIPSSASLRGIWAASSMQPKATSRPVSSPYVSYLLIKLILAEHLGPVSSKPRHYDTTGRSDSGQRMVGNAIVRDASLAPCSGGLKTYCHITGAMGSGYHADSRRVVTRRGLYGAA